MKPSVQSENRFESDATRYAAYLETPEGRLRTDLTLANVQDFLPSSPVASLRALDLGCGPGLAAIRLAQIGIDVTALDSSRSMLDLAERTIADAGLADKIKLKYGDTLESSELFPARSFDIVLCHNLLEYVDDPIGVLHAATRLLRDSSSILSVLVRNWAGEVLKAAVKEGDLAAVERNLVAGWGQESLYGGKVRLFAPETLEAVLTEASLTPIAQRGVRVISDYLPEIISRSSEYDRIFDLERELGKRPEFVGIARYLHYLARHVPRSGIDG